MELPKEVMKVLEERDNKIENPLTEEEIAKLFEAGETPDRETLERIPLVKLAEMRPDIVKYEDAEDMVADRIWEVCYASVFFTLVCYLRGHCMDCFMSQGQVKLAEIAGDCMDEYPNDPPQGMRQIALRSRDLAESWIKEHECSSELIEERERGSEDD